MRAASARGMPREWGSSLLQVPATKANAHLSIPRISAWRSHAEWMQGGVRARVGVGWVGGLKGPKGYECRELRLGQAGCEAVGHCGLGTGRGQGEGAAPRSTPASRSPSQLSASLQGTPRLDSALRASPKTAPVRRALCPARAFAEGHPPLFSMEGGAFRVVARAKKPPKIGGCPPAK